MPILVVLGAGLGKPTTPGAALLAVVDPEFGHRFPGDEARATGQATPRADRMADLP
jgi:hypothetical protein